MRNQKYFGDLHLHSIYSDGFYSARQVIRDSALIGMNVIALTDHDTTRGFEEAYAEGELWGKEVIPGVEISTLTCHILGYCFDLDNRNFQELLKFSRYIQEQVSKNRINIFNEIGLPLTFEKVKRIFPESRIGKVNLAYAALMDPECRDFLGNITLNEFRQKYLNVKSPEVKEHIKPDEAISVIHKANGIAVLAHPFKQFSDSSELECFVNKGLDGIEVQPNYNERNEHFIRFAKHKGLLMTYGSDYHGPAWPERPYLTREDNLIKRFW